MKEGLELKFKKDIFQETKLNKETGEFEIDPKIKTMYHLEIRKDYFIDDKEKILKQVIYDLKQKIKELEEIKNINEIEGR